MSRRKEKYRNLVNEALRLNVVFKQGTDPEQLAEMIRRKKRQQAMATPATEGQLNFLKVLGIQAPEGVCLPVAANLIRSELQRQEAIALRNEKLQVGETVMLKDGFLYTIATIEFHRSNYLARLQPVELGKGERRNIRLYLLLGATPHEDDFVPPT
jgi:hypothetical protein